MHNHFDVTRSKCRQTKPIVWATLLILMSRHADRSSSPLYLADLRSMQYYGCKFATVVTERVKALHSEFGIPGRAAGKIKTAYRAAPRTGRRGLFEEALGCSALTHGSTV